MLYFETGCLFLGGCKTYACLHTAASTSTVCSSQLTRCWLQSPAFLYTRQLDQTQVLWDLPDMKAAKIGNSALGNCRTSTLLPAAVLHAPGRSDPLCLQPLVPLLQQRAAKMNTSAVRRPQSCHTAASTLL